MKNNSIRSILYNRKGEEVIVNSIFPTSNIYFVPIPWYKDIFYTITHYWYKFKSFKRKLTISKGSRV